MNEVTLGPSPNWYLSSILSCSNSGFVAWGARNSIVAAKPCEATKSLDYHFIEKAHAERVTSLAFSSKNEDNIVSGGDENVVKIWKISTLTLEKKNSILDIGHKVVAVDWSKHDPSVICFVSESGFMVSWDIEFDKSQLITLGKISATCLKCCPHDKNIVSVGTKSGLVYIIDIRGSGTINYKLRGHDLEIVSLSWCPVPINIMSDNENNKEFLLSSGAKDRSIFLWRAGSDGRYQSHLTFPAAPFDSSNHKNKVSASSGNFTSVCWLTPTLLLSGSPWGELLLWDLASGSKKKIVPRLIHGKHGKGLFSIAGITSNSVESFENGADSNWRSRTNLKYIWTLAQDRLVVCTHYQNDEPSIEYMIPTQGGFVYCLAACPLDTSQIAFGAGDAMIRLWNLSEPHKNIIEPQILWEKIKGQVRALAWHPEKENLLAFATNEGRVGVFDTNVRKPPILYRQYHRHVVYAISWGLAPNVKEYALYSCGDGELVYYIPDKINDQPCPVLKKKDCTEFCWKSDYSIMAVGFADGSISFYNSNLTQCGNSIHVLNKSVQRLVWHPDSTSSDLSISKMNNYLAVAVNDTAITIFDIDTSALAEESDKINSYKVVGTLNGHSEKVVCLSWSPHMSGYLISGSYDATIQVWKVETQEIIATYISHLGPIQCCMWSPFSQDLIITGSMDFTLRVWSISKQKVIKPSSSTKINVKGKRTKKKKTKTEALNADIINGINIEENNFASELTIEKKENIENPREVEVTNDTQNTETSKVVKKKRVKKVTHFPGYLDILKNNHLWCSSMRNVMNISETDEKKDMVRHSELSGKENEDNLSNSNGNFPSLFGSKNDLLGALNYEKNILKTNELHNVVTEIDVWTGNIEESINQAMRNKRLNDFIVALSPNISMETWMKVCEAYANQLIFEENPHKAASYFLCINKVEKAIDTFVVSKLYKEAYSVAAAKLDSNNPLITNVLTEWANVAQADGDFQNAAACHIKLKNYEKAARLLERRKDINSLKLAIELAEKAKNIDLTMSLADKTILQAAFDNDFATVQSVIEKYPKIQHRGIEIEVFCKLQGALKEVNNEEICNWLKGKFNSNLRENIRKNLTQNSDKYSTLLAHDIPPTPVSEKSILMNFSHQLTLALLCTELKDQVCHLIKAIKFISENENLESVMSEKKSLILMKFLSILDNKLMDKESIFNYDEVPGCSLRAYLCHAIINWYLESEVNEGKDSDYIESIVEIIIRYSADLLSKESIKFWTTLNEINSMEDKLAATIGKLKRSEDDDLDEATVIDCLDHLRRDKKQFEEERISSPNPLTSYSSILEFISKIKDERIHDETLKLIHDVWEKAIS